MKDANTPSLSQRLERKEGRRGLACTVHTYIDKRRAVDRAGRGVESK